MSGLVDSPVSTKFPPDELKRGAVPDDMPDADDLGNPLGDAASDSDESFDEDIDFPSYGMNMHKILRGLYIGDFRASQQFPVLAELGITQIIAASPSPAPAAMTLIMLQCDRSTRRQRHAFETSALELSHLSGAGFQVASGPGRGLGQDQHADSL
jgi:hypothetical protein